MGGFTPRTKELSMTWGKRLIFVILILTGLFYGVFKLAERNTDAMRKGIEDYLTTASGHPAHITSMTTLKLMPDIVFRLKGVDVIDKTNSKKGLLHANNAYFSMPFWHMFFGLKNFIGFEIQGLEIASDFYLPKKLSASFFGISDPSPEKGGTPTMILDGTYNDRPLLITLEMLREAKKKHYLYSFGKSFPFTFKLGETEADGLVSHEKEGVSYKGVQMVRGDDRAEFVVKNIQSDPLNAVIEGTINDQAFNANLKKSGEDMMLTIVPDAGASLEKISAFVEHVKTDFGIGSENAPVTIKIQSPDQAKKQETEIKE